MEEVCEVCTDVHVVLGHVGDVLVEVALARVLAVEGELAGDLAPAQPIGQELDQRRLAAAGRAQEDGHLTRLKVEADVMQQVLLGLPLLRRAAQASVVDVVVALGRRQGLDGVV